MNKKYEKLISTKVWIIISVVFIFVGIICFWFHNNYPGNDYIMSLIGSLCSLFGLVVAIVQIVKSTKASIEAKKAAENVKTVVDKNIHELNRYFSYSSISQCEKLVDEIEALIHSKSIDRLFVRLKELKDSVIDISNNNKLERFIKSCNTDFNKNIILLQTDIDAIGKKINDSNNTINFDIIFTHAETIKTDLTKIASKLKYEKL